MSVIDFSLQQRLGHFQLDASAHLPATGVTALFGPSGSGKSTLLQVLAGLIKAQGHIKLPNSVWQNDDKGVCLPAHQRAVGYVFQQAELFPHLTVLDNLCFGYQRLQPSQRIIQRDAVIELLALGGLLQRHPVALSGGEQQRVAIGRALLTSPDWLLMDEPLSGLDSAKKHEIMHYLNALHQSWPLPILYVSHVMEEISQLADWVLLMDQGRITHHGRLQEVLVTLDAPLAHGADAGTLIEAKVLSHDESFQLTDLQFAGGVLSIPKKPLPLHAVYKVYIHARDVSIALDHHDRSSILNVFSARIEAIVEEDASRVLVKLTASGAPLLSSITRKSAVKLNLALGDKVYAQVKSVALMDAS